MRDIWFLNHYADSTSGRHYKFGYNLTKMGYSVKIFAASTLHGSCKNRIAGSEQFVVDDEGGFPCIFVRARDYSGNGRARVYNMIDYAWRLMFVTKKFDEEKPDVIYASSVHPLTWLSGYFLARRYGAKFVAETRDLWPETLVAMGQIQKNSIQATVLYMLEKFIYKKAARLVFTMPGGIDYVERLGIDKSKVDHINNGVDIAEFNRNREKYVFSDPALDDPNTFKVVYAGSMGQANALGYLVEAAEIIQSKGFKNVKFLLFGDGYQREELRSYAERKGLTNIILYGRVEKKYIPGILSRCALNVFVGQNLPLYKYGLSLNKMFEYFASGKPTISNVQCGYDLLKKYQCGVTVRDGSAEVLASGILNFYSMPYEEYRSYCERSLEAAREYDFDTLTHLLEATIS